MTQSAHEPLVAGAMAKHVVRVGLLLRPKNGADPAKSVAAMAAVHPRKRRLVACQELDASYGASPEDVAAVEAFAAKHGLEVVEVNRAGRLVILRATLEAFAESLRCKLKAHDQQGPGKVYHRPEHPIGAPTELADLVEGIFGLDNLPRFLRHDRADIAVGEAAPAVDDQSAAAPSRPSTHPAEVMQRYLFPSNATGRGQKIAILLLGGGFYMEDVKAFFADKIPKIQVVEVGGATNDPAPREAITQFLTELRSGQAPTADAELRTQIWWTLEATVDVQLAASFAPDAELVVYFANNDELGKIEGLTAVLTDAENDPQVLSCSWGASEAELDIEFVRATDRIFQVAALRGISVCYASGDKGTRIESGQPTPDFPAASPHVISCGGTILPGEAQTPESVWYESKGPLVLATGGGFSGVFERPGWQQGVPDAPDGQPRRGVPDVAAKADYAIGYDLLVAGGVYFGGGTSSAAPLWAALLARFNEALGTRLGWVTPLFYLPRYQDGLDKVEDGGNGYFKAASGWDACTGWGTPKGERLLSLLLADEA